MSRAEEALIIGVGEIIRETLLDSLTESHWATEHIHASTIMLYERITGNLYTLKRAAELRKIFNDELPEVMQS